MENSNDIRISVIVIGYNIKNYIKRCLDSILGQSVSPFEVIFVDDGSTDGTAEYVIDNYYNYVKVIRKENGGIISARKEGLKVSSGEYVLFIDGDDELNVSMISNMHNNLIHEHCFDPDIIVTCPIEEKINNSVVIRKSICNYHLKGFEYLEGILKEDIVHFMFSKLYRRDFVLQCGYLDYPNITMGEDLLTNTFLGVFQPRVSYIEQENYIYKYNLSSETRNGHMSIINRQIQMLSLIEEYLKFKGLYDRFHELLNYQWYLFAFGYFQTPFSHGFKKELMRLCKSHYKGIRNNIYYKNQKRGLSFYYGRSMFVIYYYFPLLSAPCNLCARALIRLMHVLRIL